MKLKDHLFNHEYCSERQEGGETAVARRGTTESRAPKHNHSLSEVGVVYGTFDNQWLY